MTLYFSILTIGAHSESKNVFNDLLDDKQLRRRLSTCFFLLMKALRRAKRTLKICITVNMETRFKNLNRSIGLKFGSRLILTLNNRFSGDCPIGRIRYNSLFYTCPNYGSARVTSDSVHPKP